jgi:protein SCO1/2
MKHVLFALVLLTSFPAWARTPESQRQVLDKVGFVQRLDEQLPLDTPFRNEQGQDVTLKDYFGRKPVILNLVYFDCPMLCTEVLNGLVRTLRAIPLQMGRDYTVLTISFDPKETSALAAAKKRVYVDRYGRKGGAEGWNFLTGNAASIKRVTDTVGFYFTYDPELKQFAHASGVILLTPQGKVARYFYGVEYPPQDLRLSLVEASENKIGSPVDKLLLYCYHYDPSTGRYGFLIMRIVRIAALCTALSLITCIWIMIRHEKRYV